MEVVRKFIDASSLMSIMTLPEAFRDHKLEVIILPTEERSAATEKKEDIVATVKSLIGMIPNDDSMSLKDYREERLKKYETVD